MIVEIYGCKVQGQRTVPHQVCSGGEEGEMVGWEVGEGVGVMYVCGDGDACEGEVVFASGGYHQSTRKNDQTKNAVTHAGASVRKEVL